MTERRATNRRRLRVRATVDATASDPATPVTFATPDDLAARLGVTFTTDEQTRASSLLALVSGLIQREARQTISLVENDVLVRPGTPDGRFRLPERPVVSVSAVTLNGAAVTVDTDDSSQDGYVLVGDTLFRRLGWGYADQPVSVTYTHGYATIPDAIRAVCLEPVVRVWVNPGSVVQETYGSESAMYVVRSEAPIGLMLNVEEQRVIHDVLRRPAGTVQLR